MKKSHTYLLVGIVVILSLFVVSYATANKKPASRLAMEYAEKIIREKKPSPPEAARFYAFVAGVYADAHGEAGASAALFADAKIIGDIYPDKATDSLAVMTKIAHGERNWGIIPASFVGSRTAPLTITKYEERDKNDTFHTLKWDRKIPEGAEHWYKRDKDPAAPMAGEWTRWNIDASPMIPPPYDYMGTEYKADLTATKDAVAHIDDAKRALVNFWGGTPGTETPSGIWQERLWATTRADKLSDSEYAYAQKVLAESLADSFMECWKVKYTYWATRPDMADPTLVTPVMPNPPFPSYPSGHSTISATAAAVLSELFPEKKDIYWNDAAAARDSRLNAGIHFPHDNDEGFILGRKVGERIGTLLKLSPLRGQMPNVVKMQAEPRKASYEKGNHLYALSQNDGSAFFIATDAPLLGRTEKGWLLKEISKDDFWDPRICATMPTVILPGGNILVRETKVSPDKNGALVGHTSFVYFDAISHALTSMFPGVQVLGDLYLTTGGSPLVFINDKGIPKSMTVDPAREFMNPTSLGRELKIGDSVTTCDHTACINSKDGSLVLRGDTLEGYTIDAQIKKQNDMHAREKAFLSMLGTPIVGRKASLVGESRGSEYYEVTNPLDAYDFSYYSKMNNEITALFKSDMKAHAFHYTIGIGGN